MGAGRSGSTILGVALGNANDVVYVGELDAWSRREGQPDVLDEATQSFWRSVRCQVEAVSAETGEQYFRALERSTALFSPVRWREARRLRATYRQTYARLYRAIARVACTSWVADTSHYPLRARELRRAEEINLYLIYLVRDPHGVVASFGKTGVGRSKSVVAANCYLFWTHVLSCVVYWTHRKDRRLFMRYEEFVERPAEALQRLLAMSGIASAVPDTQRLHSGVPFRGNRLVKAETIGIRSMPEAPARRAWLTTVMQMPWTAVFWWLDR
jgi:hypothetical protein